MYLASISNDLKIYECESWSHVFSYGNHDGLLRHMEWSNDGKYFLQVNPAGRIEVLSVTQDGVRCLQCLPEEESSAAAFHRGGHRQIAVGCRSGRIFLWDTKFKSVAKTFTNAQSTVKMLDFNSKNTYLAAGLDNGDTVIYGVTTNQQIGTINIPNSNKVSTLRFHSELRSILGLASDEGCILLRDLATGKNKMYMKDAHKSIVSGISYSLVNQDVMVSCGYDKVMNIYDIRKQIIITNVKTDCALTCVDMNGDNYVALGNKKGQVQIYDLRNLSKSVQVFSDNKTVVTKVGFQPEVAKKKHLCALDASLKETFSPRLSTKECKTPESVRSYDFIEQFNSPMLEVPSPNSGDGVDASKDSFLVNIVGGNNDSVMKSIHCSSPENIKKALEKSAIKTSQNSGFSRKPFFLGSEKSSECGTSASTPICARMVSIDKVSPSPIYKNDLNDYDMSDNSPAPKCRSPIKKIDSLDSVSVVETVKYAANTVSELGNELKDFIASSIYDVLEQSKNNFMQMTMQQTKNRLYLEDQITCLAEKVNELQQTQGILIEENRKLSIEVEMLRSLKNM